MKLPQKIDIQVICDNERNLEDIIVRMIVHAGTKNPFFIYFPKTDNEGKTSLTADEFKDQFESYYEIGLMDYNGNIETAHDVVNFDLNSQDKLAPSLEIVRKRHLLGYERLIWRSSDEMIEYFLSCKNSKFFANPQSIEIQSNSIIQFVVSRRIG